MNSTATAGSVNPELVDAMAAFSHPGKQMNAEFCTEEKV